MIINNTIYRQKIDLIFLSLLFTIPMVSTLLFKLNSNDVRILFVVLVSLWGFLNLFFKWSNVKLTLLDLFALLFLGYVIVHFWCFSETSYFDSRWWSYLGYLGVFYVFKWILEDKTQKRIHIFLLLIIVNCVIQCGMALLQYFEYLEVRSNYFTLVGSFTSPNHLAAYLGIGFCILIWYLFIYKDKKKWATVFSIFCLILFGSLIVMSNSRTAWLGIIGAMGILFITSKKNRLYLKRLSVSIKIIGSMLLVLLIFIGSNFLYSLKPESVNGRGLIAKITLQEIAKKPLLGHGLFSFAGGYNSAKVRYFESEERSWDEIQTGTYVFTAFNDYLLLGYELGLLFLFTLLVLVFFVLIKIKITPETRIGLAIFINLCVMMLFTSIIGNVPLFIIGLFAFAILHTHSLFNKQILGKNKYINHLLVAVILITSSVSLYASSVKVISEKTYKNYIANNKDSLDTKKLIRLSIPLRDNRISDYNLGRLLYQSGKKEEGYMYMERAYKITSAPKIGKTLANCHLRDKNYKRAEEIYRFNKYVEPYRYEARMDLLNLLSRSNRYEEMSMLSKEIIDLPVKIPSEKVKSYKKSVNNIYYYFYRNPIHGSHLKGSISRSEVIKSKILNVELSYKIYLPPIHKITTKLPVIYINDGHWYIRNGKFPELLDSLITNNHINPVAAVFISSKNPSKEYWKQLRQKLFLCNPEYVTFFTEELIPQIEKKYPVSNNREDRTILGLSFGGLAAAYIGDKKPNYFKNIAMQSPAFHPCKDIYLSYDQKPKKDLKMYLSYGTGKDTEKQDIPMVNILHKKGYEIKVERIENGNHSWDIWKEQLDNILFYFYKNDNSREEKESR